MTTRLIYYRSQNVQANLAVLSKVDLHFELQMPFANLRAVNSLMDHLKHNDSLKLVINHCGSIPSLEGDANNVNQHWQTGLKLIASYPNCSIKCSGWEMVDKNYNTQGLETMTKAIIALFGMSRVMLASNFPLTLFSKSYSELWQCYLSLGFSVGRARAALLLQTPKKYMVFQGTP